ncbi:MAG: glycosyltransferase [Thermodesulfobacteriota bacterium]
MIRILRKMGYIIDVIDFKSHLQSFDHNYDVIIDVDINLQLYGPLFENAIKIMHITTGYGRYLNAAELSRVKELEKRRGLRYSPKRLVHYLELFDRSLEIADHCSLIGNSVTKSTFPDSLQKKITPITVSASKLNSIKSSEQYVPEEREFLWFFGMGAVTKGLDLLLEIFPNHPEYTLNIIGYLDAEPDFMKIYNKELTQYKNIRYHGSMSPLSKEFESIVRRCFCFIAPTCSEGLSPAVATLMQVGLYPIISKTSGADLPQKAGIFLNEISIEEIDAKIKEVYNKKDNELVDEIKNVQSLAIKRYSREQFSKEINSFFAQVLS